MQLKLFILPVKNLDAAEGEMNGSLRSHRVLAVKKEFVADGENSFWTFCVEYLDSTAGAATWPGKGPKVDYKEVLKPEEFDVFSRLREWRKAAAEKEDDVGIQDDNHRRWARTSRTTCSTAASSSAVGLGWERLRSSRVAHCSGVRGWCFRRTMEPP